MIRPERHREVGGDPPRPPGEPAAERSPRPRLLSSRTTPIQKFVVPPLMVVGVAHLARFLWPMAAGDAVKELGVILLTAALGVVAVIAFAITRPLRRVRLGGEFLYVSNYLHEIRVPLSDVKEVTTDWNPRRQRNEGGANVIVTFHHQTSLGSRAAFRPRMYLRPVDSPPLNPVVDELRHAVHHHFGRSRSPNLPPGAHRPEREGHIDWRYRSEYRFAAVVGAVALCLLPWTLHTGRDMLRNRQALGWPTVEGQIVQSGYHFSYMDGGKSRAAIYQTDLIYSYLPPHSSIVHYERQGAYFGQHGVYLREARRIAATYPVGAKVTVAYDPRKPRSSTLEPGKIPDDFVLAVLLEAMCIVPTIILCWPLEVAGWRRLVRLAKR